MAISQRSSTLSHNAIGLLKRLEIGRDEYEAVKDRYTFQFGYYNFVPAYSLLKILKNRNYPVEQFIDLINSLYIKNVF